MNRRSFLAAGIATGFVGHAAADEPAPRLTRAEIPTPGLIVDLDRFEANLRTMADHCRRAGCGFRPHAKTHKCPEIARRQVASGALGVCVATVPEAEAMVAGGIRGVLLTSPVADRGKAERVAALARTEGQVMAALDSTRGADLLDAAARAISVRLDVLVDLDVGSRRTGITPGPPAVELAQHVTRYRNLRFRGLQGYAGHASHTTGFAERSRVSRESMARAVETKDLLTRAGIEVAILSGGSTGTYNIDPTIAGVTELQVGSYIFMDVEYRRIGGQSGAVYTDFQPSLMVVTTVVSATHADRVTVDAGTKAFATDVPDRPEAVGRPGVTYQRAGDEFGILRVTGDATLPRLGERIEFLVPHCDPTVNLYDRIYAVRGERVEAIWPVAARRETTR
jgi:D-serine deaminase-like pyridoxal phosphate-dependent protein